MGRLLIVGASGHGKVAADAALCQGSWTTIAFLDDRAPQIPSVVGLDVIGTTAELARLIDDETQVVVAIGEPRRRLEFLAGYRDRGYPLALIVHPAATVSRFAEIGAGSVVFAGAVIQAGARLGIGCIVNTAASIDHDCTLGDGVHVCPGARVAGTVVVGTGSWLGIGASIRNNLRIGQWVTVGAGAAVVTDVADGETVMGVPARPVRGPQ